MSDRGLSAPDSPAEIVMAAMREASALGILYSAMVARRLGVSSSDLECLDFVATQQPVTAGALAKATGLTTGAITGVINRLIKAGFVERDRPASDRRKVLLTTTAAFRTEVVPLFEPMQRLQGEVIAGRTDAQLQDFAAFLLLSLNAARQALAALGESKEK